MESRSTAVVVGSGFGGIALALRLQGLGYDVTMVEKLDFDGVEDFQDKLVTLKENFFNEDDSVKTPLVEEFAVSEEEAMKENSAELTPTMDAYATMLKRINSVDNNKIK